MTRWMRLAPVWALILVLGGLLAYRHAAAPARPPAPADDIVAQDRAILARSKAKGEVAAEVIAGRRSLLEAAAAFRDLDRRTLPKAAPVELRFPEAASEDEAYCRSVLEYVKMEAPPSRPDLSRLAAELNDRLRDGTLVLPTS